MGEKMKYIKLTGVFVIIELMLTFIMSLMNLIGVNSGITSLLILIFNIIIFLILSIINGKKSNKNGFLSGLLLSFIYIILMFLINGFLYKFSLRISTIIYYLMLIIISMIGGSIGINQKKEDN